MTGELISIFEEAKHDALLYLLQKQWDLNLIKSWRDRPFLPMAACAGDFERKHKDGMKEKLQRFPKYAKAHFGVSVSRFIAAFLPKTNNALWDGRSDEEVLAVMASERLLDRCADFTKATSEFYVRSKTKKTFNAVSAEDRARRENNERHARRNWSAVK